ncbi:LysR family transcriptional regulator [Pseudomonas syringae]|nr:LysR family transcriptional regulator [Pseudomonas syringae]MCF5068774.1 LysR family transcriptional regulator [Pseudomonas syringae]
MHFDFTDLSLYLNILDTGNITAGAARSHLSLAAASARIRAMEASLGTEFLQRGRRGVTPTAAGKALAHHARILLQQAERMQQDLADYAQGVKGQVRLLCNTTAITEYLPEVLADFLRSHPNLDIDLQELPSARITHALRQGAADLGIVSDAVDTTGLQTLAFRDDPLVLILPLDHPMSGAMDVSFSEALQHDFVGLSADSALAVYLEEQALHSGARMQIRIRADGFDGVMRMVARGAGLAIVPLAAVERATPQAFKCLPLNEPWAQRTLQLCARDFSALPAYACALLQSLSDPRASGQLDVEHRQLPG